MRLNSKMKDVLFIAAKKSKYESESPVLDLIMFMIFISSIAAIILYVLFK